MTTKRTYPLLCAIALLPFCLTAQDVGAKWVIPPVMDGFESFEISPKEDDSRFIVKNGKMEGVFNKSGAQVLPPAYNRISLHRGGWITAAQDRMQFLFNEKGENIGLPYDKFQPPYSNVAVVWKNAQCGLINTHGEELIPLEYEKWKQEGARFIFTKGDAERYYDAELQQPYPNVVRVENAKARSKIAGYHQIDVARSKAEMDLEKTYQAGYPRRTKSGLLNLKGDTIIPPLYQFGSFHSAGYLTACIVPRQWGVLTLGHKNLYPFQAERMGRWTRSGLLPVKNNGEWGILRFPKAEVVLPFGEYWEIETYDPERDIFLVKKDKYTGLINLKNEPVFPFGEFSYIEKPKHRTTLLIDPQTRKGTFYPPTGYIIEPQFKWVNNLDDSLVIFCHDTSCAVMNAANGQLVIPFTKGFIERTGTYFDLHWKYDSTLTATAAGRLHSLYDRQGRLIYGPDSVDIHVFADQTFWVKRHFKAYAQQDEHRTADGKVLRSMQKFKQEIRHGAWIYVGADRHTKTDAYYFLYSDPPGKETRYPTVDKISEGLHRVCKDGLCGYMDTNWQWIIPRVFEKAGQSKDGYITVKYQGKWGVLQNPVFDYFEQFEK
ncbi:MAG: WG repeat-containing protein [Lewinellaceae bacterium]|nr:WG repeat-containing protein [Saprospiraceae bacterium]MCB9332694.1 WG repeat-containing protein [Lewinellaceae bacterium]